MNIIEKIKESMKENQLYRKRDKILTRIRKIESKYVQTDEEKIECQQLKKDYLTVSDEIRDKRLILIGTNDGHFRFIVGEELLGRFSEIHNVSSSRNFLDHVTYSPTSATGKQFVFTSHRIKIIRPLDKDISIFYQHVAHCYSEKRHLHVTLKDGQKLSVKFNSIFDLNNCESLILSKLS